MNLRRYQFVLCLVGAFILGIVFTGGALLIKNGGSMTAGDAKFDELDQYIDQYYLEDYDKKELQENAYRGYVAGLGDPYSAYLTKEDYEQWEVSTTGSYSGVGITFSEDQDGNFTIISVTKNSPADKAGFKPGDMIIAVDGETYTDIDVMASNIRGKEGTEVTVQYIRDNETKEATMTRAHIDQESIEYEMLDADTGYIHITQFIDNTADDFEKALNDIESKGAKSLVLDLRDNGGGLVVEAVDIADQFLDEGVVCYVEDKNGDTEEYSAFDGKTSLKTTVLMNGNSASASEILGAALQDNGYTIVGEKSYGKGIIQTTFDLENGDAIKLTIMRYLSPDKHEIHKKGIKPDVKVKDDEKTDADEQLDKAIELVK